MRKRPEKAESHDEAQVFLAAVRGVKPFAEIELPAGLAKPKPRAKRHRDLPAQNSPLGEVPSADALALPDEFLSYRRAGVQDKLMKRLRRGLIPAESAIDLHGFTQQAAWDVLREYLDECRSRNVRCVRIIHGKGYRSGTRSSVLKTAVNSWLRRNHDVVAFTSARAIDGGRGALYVLLRA